MCKCGQPSAPGGRYCNPCRAAYMRDWRLKFPLSDAEKAKSFCRQQAAAALKRGDIVRKPCERCGGLAQMHHADVSKPLEPRWLCRSCRAAEKRDAAAKKFNAFIGYKKLAELPPIEPNPPGSAVRGSKAPGSPADG